MHDVITQVLTYIRGAWRYRWHAQLVAWPLCLGGLLMVHMLPNQYEATARVFVDTKSMLRPLLQGLAVQTNADEQVQMIIRTLLSRPNLEKVARATDLDLRAKTPEELDELLARLSRKIQMSNNGRDNIFSITYTDSDPQMTHRVVQSLVTLFVESSLGDTRKDSTAAQQFIDEQIRTYEGKLLAAEDQLKEFKRKNVNVMPNSAVGYYDRLQGEMTQLERAKLDMSEAVNRRDELQRQLSGEVPTFGLVPRPNVPTTELGATPNSQSDARLRTMEARLDELLLRYTKQHPDVVELSRQIEELRERDKQRQASIPAPAPRETSNLDASMATNPVYQRLKAALGEAEADVASLRVRVNEYQTRVNNLRNLVDVVPQVEAELARLNRDYTVNKQNYETLIARRESAKLSQEAEQSSDNLKFKIVDPPRVPLKPIGPKRLLFASAVLVGSIVFGVLFAFFMAQVKPVFYTSRDVLSMTHTPVLGYVSMVWSNGERLRNRIGMVSYLLVATGLIAMYGAFVAFQIISGNAVN